MAQPFVFMELSTPDASKAKAFYHDLFDWSFGTSEPGGDDYSLFRPDIGAAGAIYSAAAGSVGWLPYINVEDVQASTAKAQALGAKLIRGVQEIPGHGWTSILEDPWGAPIAFYQNSETRS